MRRRWPRCHRHQGGAVSAPNSAPPASAPGRASRARPRKTEPPHDASCAGNPAAWRSLTIPAASGCHSLNGKPAPPANGDHPGWAAAIDHTDAHSALRRLCAARTRVGWVVRRAQNVQFWIMLQAWRTSLRLCADVRAAGWGAAPRQLIPAGYSGCLVIACTEPDLGWPAGLTASCVRLW